MKFIYLFMACIPPVVCIYDLLFIKPKFLRTVKHGKVFPASPDGGSPDISWVKIHFPNGKKKRVELFSEFRKIKTRDVDINRTFPVFYHPPKKFAVETELTREQYIARSKRIPAIVYVTIILEILFLTLYYTSDN